MTVGGWLYFLCTLSTANERRNEVTAMIVNAVGGCAALAVWLNGVLPLRRMIVHIGRMREKQPEAVAFEAPRIGEKPVQIPHSIVIRRVSVTEGGETRCLLIEESRKRALGELPEKGVLYAVDDYIAAVESGEEP